MILKAHFKKFPLIFSLCLLWQTSYNQEVSTTHIDSLQSIVDSLRKINFNITEKIYAHNLFKSDSIKVFDGATITKIPNSYIIGIGDEITLSIFGESQFDAKFQVDASGFIQPEDMPKIFLEGLRWDQARELIIKRFNRYYIFGKNQIAVNLTAPRTVTINVFGNVNRPGTYSLPATNTVFNAIVAAGGPRPNASVRNIKLSAGGQTKIFDVYDLLDNPVKQFDFYLEDNTIIQVPLSQKVVTIEGAVKRPLDYEIAENENLKNLLHYAGGFKANAKKDLIQIKRYTDKDYIILDIDMESLTNQNIKLSAGDVITIHTINENLSNFVKIEGAVLNPGEFSLSSSKTIYDLISKATLKKDADKNKAFLYRENKDLTTDIEEINLARVLANRDDPANVELEAKDILVIQSLSSMITNRIVKISGAVNIPITIDFDPDSTLNVVKVIQMAGGINDDAADFGYLIREDIKNSNNKSYVKINIKNALTNTSGKDNFKLHGNDEIIVLKNSNYTDQLYIHSKGEVRKPQTLFYDPNLSIGQIIELSEGLTEFASGKIDIYRLVLNKDKSSTIVTYEFEVDKNYNIISGDSNFRMEPNDEVVFRTSANIDGQNFVKIKGEVNYPGEYVLSEKKNTLGNLIAKAGGFTEEAFQPGIQIFRSINKSVEDTSKSILAPIILHNDNQTRAGLNIILEKLDSIYVPAEKNIVEIYINNSKFHELQDIENLSEVIGVQYVENKTADWYINNYVGGFGEFGDKSKVYVQYPNGELKKTDKFLWKKKYPIVKNGSKIFIGTKEPENMPNSSKDQSFKLPKSVKGVVIYQNGETQKSSHRLKTSQNTQEKKSESTDINNENENMIKSDQNENLKPKVPN